MAGNWTKLTVKGKTGDLDQICAVMSMLDTGLMIEDFSDFSFSGMYGELVDESILSADKESVKVSLFVLKNGKIAFATILGDCIFLANERLCGRRDGGKIPRQTNTAE